MQLLVLLACFLAPQVASGVPSSLKPSCGSEFITIERGATLRLPCGSLCQEGRGDFTWWRVSEPPEGDKRQLSFSGAVVTEDSVTGESGGGYGCQCGSSGQICTFYVAVLPEVTFTASHSATHYGDVVTLTCTIEGYPANYTTITNAYGIPLQTQAKRKMDSSRLETLAVVRDIEEEDYLCEVETHYKGHPITQKKENLKINLYNPPSIMYTTEYVLHEEAEFGRPGHLSCVVQTSPDTVSHVTWWAGGEQLVEGGKYRMTSSAMSSEVTVFELEMETVELSDIGPYLCRLSTQYNIEESQDAWIKVDYRNEATGGVGGGTVISNAGRGSGDSAALSTSSLRSVAVVMCLVTVAGLGTWGVVVRRRSSKKRGRSYGIIGRGQESPSPLSRPSLVGHSRLSVFKRK